MDPLLGGAGSILVLAILIFSIVLTILWILVPFAIFGTKPLLRQILSELRRANDLAARAPVNASPFSAPEPVPCQDDKDPSESPLQTIRAAVRQARAGDQSPP